MLSNFLRESIYLNIGIRFIVIITTQRCTGTGLSFKKQKIREDDSNSVNFKGAMKLYFMYYVRVVAILFGAGL